MEKWYVAAKKADFDKWAKEFHISPVTARILRNRDLTEESQIPEVPLWKTGGLLLSLAAKKIWTGQWRRF